MSVDALPEVRLAGPPYSDDVFCRDVVIVSADADGIYLVVHDAARQSESTAVLNFVVAQEVGRALREVADAYIAARIAAGRTGQED